MPPNQYKFQMPAEGFQSADAYAKIAQASKPATPWSHARYLFWSAEKNTSTRYKFPPIETLRSIQ